MCCDINDDCYCDRICGGNDDRWPREAGYNATLGCSYDHNLHFHEDDEEFDNFWKSGGGTFIRFIGVILFVPIVFLAFFLRPVASGWSHLATQYSNVGERKATAGGRNLRISSCSSVGPTSI